MDWLLGPWSMSLSATLWLFQTAAYMSKRDWGHAVMAFSYSVATWGLVYAWYRPVGG